MASSAESFASDAPVFRCPICLDVYTAPKNLPCLHTYCQHCLHKYIMENVPEGKKGAKFSCPECRKETFPPFPDIPVNKWAEHYPYNTVLLSVLPSEKRKVEKNCDSCLYEGTSVGATSYCTVCNEALCLTCDSVHRKTKATRDHAVVNMQDLITDLELAVSLSVSVTCSEHVGKEFEFYCKPHSSMCCSECFYKCHRGCRNVLQIRDHSERLLKEKDSNKVMDRLKQLKSHLDEYKNENEASFRKIEATMKNIPDEIELIRKKINTLLDSVKSKITMEGNVILKEESIVRQEENQHCESISSTVVNSLHLLETVLAHGSPIQVMTTLHKIEEQLVYYESSLREKFCEVRHVDAKLCLDDRLLSLAKSNDTTIAKIDIVGKKHTLIPSFLPLTVQKTVNRTPVRLDPSEAKRKNVVRRKTPRKYFNPIPLKECKPEITEQFILDYPDGKDPSYSGITCLPDDRLVVIDYGNNTCRLYNSSYQHVADYTLTSKSLCACVVEGSRIAMTLRELKTIQLFNVDSSIQPVGIIKTKLSCHGIAALSREQLVVSGDMNGIIYWCNISMDGSEKSLVKVCPSQWYSGLALNNSRTRIYVSCYQNYAAVYAYSVDGVIIFRYQHLTLDGAYGVAVDREDNLYVVGQKSNNIHQVSPDGTSLQVFSNGIPKRPLAIGFCSSGVEFLLTAESERKLVHRFKLKCDSKIDMAAH